MLLYQHLRLSETFVERNFLLKSICKGHTGHCRRDGILCHLVRQITEIDLIHISHNLFAFYGLGDNNSGGDGFAGLLRVKPQGGVFAGIPHKGLTFPEALCTTLPAKPDERPVFGQF